MLRVFATLAVASIASSSALLTGGCSSDGATAVCPELPLYNPHDIDAAFKPDIRAAELAAIDAGCATRRGDAESVRPSDGGKGD